MGNARKWRFRNCHQLLAVVFLRPAKVQGSIASFRRDGDHGISRYLMKLMKSSLFFSLEN